MVLVDQGGGHLGTMAGTMTTKLTGMSGKLNNVPAQGLVWPWGPEISQLPWCSQSQCWGMSTHLFLLLFPWEGLPQEWLPVSFGPSQPHVQLDFWLVRLQICPSLPQHERWLCPWGKLVRSLGLSKSGQSPLSGAWNLGCVPVFQPRPGDIATSDSLAVPAPLVGHRHLCSIFAIAFR